jgi:hypothetical protein
MPAHYAVKIMEGHIVKTFFITLIMAFFACSVSAQETPDQRCDRTKDKAKQEACYKQLIKDRKEALEEYEESITYSTRIPPEVKAVVLKDYQSFMRNISSMCPDSACIAGAMQEQIKDMYKETARFTTAR